MCGLVAVFGRSVDEKLLSAMADTISHRGPDGYGWWVSADKGVGLAHRRLAIQDLSTRAAQPLSDHTGNLHVVFNGEIYNHLELRKELGAYPFRSSSDTEVILAAYQRWGVECVNKFNGMFAFVIWDSNQRIVFCARDRLGVKPLFYAQNKDQLFFASEIKAILAAGFPSNPNNSAWANYLTHGLYEPQDGSFFAGVFSLPPASYMVVKSGAAPEIKQYWNLNSAAKKVDLSPQEAADQLLALLEDSVGLRLRSDVPVALNLTGGLDSSSVAQSFLSVDSRRYVPHVFTACFDDPRYDEDAYADAVIGDVRCVRHRPRLEAREIPHLAEQAIWHQEAPFGGIGTLSYHHLHGEIAKEKIKVVLEGQGGDELFGGYAYYQSDYLADLFQLEGWQGARRFLKNFSDWRKLLKHEKRVRNGGGAVYQDGSEFLALDCVNLDMLEGLATPVDWPRPFKTKFENAMFRDVAFTKLPRVLRMNDRLSMAFGVELRQPFLDYRLVEFAFALPPHYKIHQTMGKYILRRAMAGRLPDDVVWCGKRPVVTPQREWMSTTLRDWVLEIIHSSSFAQRGWFDAKTVQMRFTEMLRTGINNGFPIWQWICLELWHQRFIDNR